MKDVCRLYSNETNLNSETIDECLDRILMEGDEYISWDEISGFLSRRGRPKFLPDVAIKQN